MYLGKVRKQIYVDQRQSRDQLQIDEARQAAWRRVNSTIQGLIEQGPVPGRRTWRREDLYDRT